MVQLVKPSIQSAWMVFIDGVDILFTSFSGINDTAETSSYPSGMGTRILPLVGPRTLAEITLSAPHAPDSANFKALEDLWLNYDCTYKTVTIQPVDCSEESNAIGQPYILDGCLITGIQFGEVNRDSAEASMVELTLSPGTWRRG